MKSKLHKHTVKKGRINFIDLFLLIFVIAILVWCVSYYYDLFKINQDSPFESVSNTVNEINGTLTYTVVVEELIIKDEEEFDVTLYPYIKNSFDDNVSGKITKFVFEKKTEEQETPIKATFTIEVSAVYVEGDGYFVNGKHIWIGEEIPIIMNAYLKNERVAYVVNGKQIWFKKTEPLIMTMNSMSDKYPVFKMCTGFCLDFSFVPEEE